MKPKLKIVEINLSAAGDDVAVALSLLSETLGVEQKRINDESSKAMQAGDYETAKAVIDFGERLLVFQTRVEGLAGEWEELEERRDASTPEVQAIVSKRFFGRRKKGELTPQSEYFRPILEALVEMGGSGDCKDIIAKVGEKMKSTLRPQDYEHRKSTGALLVWVNNTQWARDEMANHDGRMKPKKKTGIWEISEKGRKWLKEEKKGE